MTKKTNVNQSEEEAIAEARKRYLDAMRTSEAMDRAVNEAMLDWVEAKMRYKNAEKSALDLAGAVNEATYRYYDLVPDLYSYFVEEDEEEELSAALGRSEWRFRKVAKKAALEA